MVSYWWGPEKEFYLFGMDNLFKTAYTNNVYLRDTIVVTNKVEGVLWCEDKGIPCVSLLNDEMLLSEFFSEFVLPKFSGRFLIMHMGVNSLAQEASLAKNYEFENIPTREFYLSKFFKQGDAAVDRTMDYFEQLDGFEYIALGNPVRAADNE